MVVEEMEKELRELELMVEVEETFLKVEYLLEVKKSDYLLCNRWKNVFFKEI